MEAQPYITLNNGNKMPAVGLGTFLSSDPAELKAVVIEAVLNVGVRHIDTASLYGNEAVIGEALKECFASGKVKREDIFITTKVWQDEKHDCEAACKRSLERLQIE